MILVVDDDDLIRSFVERACQDMGLLCETGASAGDLIRMASTWVYQLIITDINMGVGGIGGAGAIQEIRNLEAPFCNVPILVFTGMGVSDAISAGATQVISKPVAVELLQGYIRDLIDREPITPASLHG